SRRSSVRPLSAEGPPLPEAAPAAYSHRFGFPTRTGPMTVVEDKERLERVLRSSGDARGNPGPDEMRRIIRRTQRIAVIGMSRDPMKAARRVPSYLAAMGADILPVNPYAGRMLGR